MPTPSSLLVQGIACTYQRHLPPLLPTKPIHSRKHLETFSRQRLHLVALPNLGL